MQWIKSYKMDQPAICDRLIAGFKMARELGFAHAGISAKGVDKEWKDSEDVSLNCLPIDIYTEVVHAYAAAGADAIEVGIPFSDPVMDGPTIQAASDAALAQGAHVGSILTALRDVDAGVPLVLMTCAIR